MSHVKETASAPRRDSQAAAAACLPLPTHHGDASTRASHFGTGHRLGDEKENATATTAVAMSSGAVPPQNELKRTRNRYEDDDTYATVDIGYFNHKDRSARRAVAKGARIGSAKQPSAKRAAAAPRHVSVQKEPENTNATPKGKDHARPLPRAADEKAVAEKFALVFMPESLDEAKCLYNRYEIPQSVVDGGVRAIVRYIKKADNTIVKGAYDFSRDLTFLDASDDAEDGPAAAAQTPPGEEPEVHIKSHFRVRGLTRAQVAAIEREHSQNILRQLYQAAVTQLQMRFLKQAKLGPWLPPHPQAIPRAPAYPVRSQTNHLGAYYGQQAQTTAMNRLPHPQQYRLDPQNPYGVLPRAAPTWQQQQHQAVRSQYQRYNQAPVQAREAYPMMQPLRVGYITQGHSVATHDATMQCQGPAHAANHAGLMANVNANYFRDDNNAASF
ncbi:hypothetical protein PHLGIDRAFT_504598 [Phlebiopsis gigantea 11061_1 CR5-6]|uniref:Uncharacterized protein n=1 Tax=Phlebiopsis gigantea (strain 11061_1 CR5-6) TaxID=745531 RepID=A0A0C3PWH2_PHLG1|nr:hypothetical protein PHLGIDRAFT_504598 [Phlebiopsis gigantea 11061_1 CR5-6]